VSAAAPARVSRGDWWLIVGWIAAISVALAGTIHDTDPYWQIRAGEENLDGVPLARPDTWSWAPVDGLFYPNSPAWNVVLALSWRAAASWGLFVVTVASIATCLALVCWLALRLGARPVPTVFGLLAITAAALPVFSPRAALVGQTLMLGAIALGLWWSRRAAAAGPLGSALVTFVAALVISTAGNWIHLSWSTSAGATAVAWIVLWLLVPGIGGWTRVALIVGGTAGFGAGVLAGPYGTDVFAQSRRVIDACQGLILEWTSPFDTGTVLRWAGPALVALLVLSAAAWSLARWPRRAGRSDQLALLAALAVASAPYVLAGLLYIRFILVALPLLAPVAAWVVTRLADRAHAAAGSPPATAAFLRRRLPEWTSDGFWRVVAWSVLAVVTPLAIFAGSRHAEPATSSVTSLLPWGCRYFGTTAEAASIILERPDVKVWIDGRADYWGRDRNSLEQRYLTSPDPRELVPPGSTCVVLSDPRVEPMIVPLIAALDASPEWRRVPGTTGAALWLPAG
jgi:hypothetical protein